MKIIIRVILIEEKNLAFADESISFIPTER